MNTGPSNAQIVPSNSCAGVFRHIGASHHMANQLTATMYAVPIQSMTSPAVLDVMASIPSDLRPMTAARTA